MSLGASTASWPCCVNNYAALTTTMTTTTTTNTNTNIITRQERATRKEGEGRSSSKRAQPNGVAKASTFSVSSCHAFTPRTHWGLRARSLLRAAWVARWRAGCRLCQCLWAWQTRPVARARRGSSSMLTLKYRVWWVHKQRQVQ